MMKKDNLLFVKNIINLNRNNAASIIFFDNYFIIECLGVRLYA